MFTKNHVVVTDYYMHYADKTNSLTLLLIHKLWLRYKNFEALGRLIAQTDVL
jgi:hypothetical protein